MFVLGGMYALALVHVKKAGKGKPLFVAFGKTFDFVTA